MKVDALYKVDGSTEINIKLIVDILESINEDVIISKVINEITQCILSSHSAEIISKIDLSIVSNLASIELGKRAAKLNEK